MELAEAILRGECELGRDTMIYIKCAQFTEVIVIADGLPDKTRQNKERGLGWSFVPTWELFISFKAVEVKNICRVF